MGARVVVGLVSPYVCLGRPVRYDDHVTGPRTADRHDLRDAETTREVDVAGSVATGLKRNRRRVLVRRSEVAAVARLGDVAAE